MKTVYIIHGWEGSPNEPMLIWLKEALAQKGFKVVVPEMPDADTPIIAGWVGHLEKIVTSKEHENIIFVGHSIGCQAILRFLEQTEKKLSIRGIVLIAPWMELDSQTIEEEGEEVKEIARPWMETPIDFDPIKVKAGKVIAFFSDNDPYVSLKQREVFEEKLGAEVIIEHNMGHFAPQDQVEEVPSILDAIENL